MTSAAGPGRTSNAAPTSKTVPPITATTTFLIVGQRSNRSASLIRRAARIFFSTATAEGCNSDTSELRELLLQLRRHVGHNYGVIPFIAQFEHMAHPVNFGDQRRLL